MHIVKSLHDLLTEARELEAAEDLQGAAGLYERAVKQSPLDERAYNRLMVIYRKEKDYAKELALIEKGIKEFQKLYAEKSRKIIGRDKEAERLSNALIKSLGLKDKKGEDLIEHEPIAKWKKRKALVEKRFSKKKTTNTKTAKKKSAK